MGRVQTLPDDVINHIAAGEVVERPASVVKELLENALDAQARRIEVEVLGGGIDGIRVDDDGIGMDDDDVVHCFQRHATSKLRTLSDLDDLHSMGFRGEALPSIAAVSRVELVSRPSQDVGGTRVIIEGGEMINVEACGAPPGTSCWIRDLFYNTPARRKFLKSPATESSHVANSFTALALTAPEVHMTLRMNGRLHTQAPVTSSLGDRLDRVFGTGLQEQLLDLDYTEGDVHISGLVARATFHRATRRQQFFFVNSRPVQSRALSHALYEAYRTMLPRERHPVAFIFMALPSHEVDVNVHPAKREVRFRHERMLYDCLRRLIQQRLQRSFSVAFPDSGAPLSEPAMPSPIERSVPSMWQSTISSGSSGSAVNGGTSCPPLEWPSAARSSAPPVADSPMASSDIVETARRDLGLYSGYPEAGREVLAGDPLGQLHDTYILVQYPSGVFIVDQHAAHERVVYERLVKVYQTQVTETQQLLFPVTLDLGGTDAEWAESCLPQLETLGFSLEPFGGSTYRLHSVPALLAERDYTAALMDVVETLRNPETNRTAEEATVDVSGTVDRVLTVMACHGALRANQRLQGAEMRALLQELAQTPRPFTCPHGRPVLLNVALSEIEKKFLRR